MQLVTLTKVPCRFTDAELHETQASLCERTSADGTGGVALYGAGCVLYVIEGTEGGVESSVRRLDGVVEMFRRTTVLTPDLDWSFGVADAGWRADACDVAQRALGDLCAEASSPLGSVVESRAFRVRVADVFARAVRSADAA